MNNMTASSESVKVVVRIRPLSSKEIREGHKRITFAHEDRASIEIQSPTSDLIKTFTFDSVFSENTTQRNVYDITAAPVVESVLMGYNGTIFVYGQTGSGKTHTMEGVPDDPESRGIIPNAFQHIFDHVALNHSDDKYLIQASYFEIYNEEIHDLLSKTPKQPLELKETVENGVIVKGISWVVVRSFDEIYHVLQSGKKNRVVASTLMNQTSSRSHSIFTVVIECCSVDTSGQEHFRVGKLNMVDLAGSERQTKTGATGDRLKEASKINWSLSSLGNVIAALVDGKSQHVPYRDSKLTRILQDSLGGNTKTVMCANAGPADFNYDETLSTLRYANRAKNIKNKPAINEDPKDTMLREYQEEISRLRAQLQSLNFPKVSNLEQENILSKLEAKLEEEGRVRADAESQRNDLLKKLKVLEAHLMVGGENSCVSDRKEASFRRTEQMLAAKNEIELRMSRQMVEQEEANIILEEKYQSLNEEVQSKTRKLKRAWSKYQQAKSELDDLRKEFQLERVDFLETVRLLTRQLKLRELVVENFVPRKYAALLDEVSNGGLAVWNEEEDRWIIPNIDLSGRNTGQFKGLDDCGSNCSLFSAGEDLMGASGSRLENIIIHREVHIPECCTKVYPK